MPLSCGCGEFAALRLFPDQEAVGDPETGPESQIRLRKGDLEKIGTRIEGAVLSENAGVADAFGTFYRQALVMAQRPVRPEVQRLCDQLAGADPWLLFASRHVLPQYVINSRLPSFSLVLKCG